MKPSRFSDKPAGILNSTDLKSVSGKTLYWVMFGILVFVCVMTFFPAMWMILTAFKTPQEMYSSTALMPSDFSIPKAIGMIKEAWVTLDLGRSMINTLIVSAGNAVASIVVCGMAGFVLSKLKVSGTKLVFTLVVWTMMMPGMVRTVSTYMSFLSFPFVIDDNWAFGLNFSILNTYWPMWLGYAASSFNIILFKNNFDAIPTTLVEAAKIDGCTNLKIFFKIMLPIASPVVIYIAIGALSGAWSDYLSPYLYLKDFELMTTPARIFMLKGDTSVTQNIYMMGLLFASIPSLIIFCVFQKYIIGGVTAGSVKG